MTSTQTAGGMTSDQIVAELRAIAAGGLQDTDEPQPIGGYVGGAHAGSGFGPNGPTVAMTGPTGATPVQEQLEGQAAIYFEGDERIPAGYSVEDIAAVQRAMANAGLLNGKFRVGLWDKKSRSAFTELLGFANQQRVEWTEALNIYASSASSQPQDDDQFRPGRFLPKDPAQYRNTVRDMFRNALGRDPDDDELARYEQELQSTEQGAFREAKAQYGEVVESGGEMTATEFGGLQSAAEADAAARFREKFEARIAPEQDFQEAQTVNREQGNLLGSILGTVDQVA